MERREHAGAASAQDVLVDARAEERGLLGDEAHALAEPPEVELPQVAPVEEHGAGDGIVWSQGGRRQRRGVSDTRAREAT